MIGARKETGSMQAAQAAHEVGRLLLVDDEQSFLEPTAEMLRRNGHHCRVAADADSASAWLAREPFDVVISDVRMPGNHGLEFVSGVCHDEDAPAVIVVTGYPSVDTAVGSIDLRVFAYLVKPIDIAVLEERVEEAVRQVRIRRGMAALEDRLERAHDDVRTLHEVFRTPQAEIDRVSMQRVLSGTSRALLSSLRDLGQLESRVLGRTAEPAAPGAAEVPAAVDLAVLSPREQEVLGLIRNGYRVATVARRLLISPHTVRNHLKRIFLKLEVGSQAELLEKLKPLNGA
jgi:DNA-binding NarL/FixJ family response regulator